MQMNNIWIYIYIYTHIYGVIMDGSIVYGYVYIYIYVYIHRHIHTYIHRYISIHDTYNIYNICNNGVHMVYNQHHIPFPKYFPPFLRARSPVVDSFLLPASSHRRKRLQAAQPSFVASTRIAIGFIWENYNKIHQQTSVYHASDLFRKT